MKCLKKILKIYFLNLISFGQHVNPLLKWSRTSWLSSQLLLEHKQTWRRESMWDQLEVNYFYHHRKMGKEWWIEIEANSWRLFYSYFLLKATLHTVFRHLFLRNVYTCTRSSHTTVTLITPLLNIQCFLLSPYLS
jgi:hypothetical protein